ncbi:MULTISPECIES: Fic family protein [unclassified Pseudodesulfovibrio]|uniref:Fic family protein n=1 Tax=unclassified Pseudodesulfovibrio TaxID=2661612 RepID=UPI000FEBD505|nr:MULTISPECIES: Fic family protein [unclassified Pseudodesulfovibrio]MCJ2164441.1 Fic family protein [Pseudodesulfovibrio sp. S3-i]RWU04644.1 Fic family protein [Pseudodesulfovibrio sp. S3]
MQNWSLIVPESQDLGRLKDIAQDLVASSASLEGRVAPETARILGGHLRLINSYYSNLIEGHKSTLRGIEDAMNKRFDANVEKRYAQDLCAAHVLAEKELMADLENGTIGDVASPASLKLIHSRFYSHLSADHLFTHDREGFTDIPVLPGEFRDRLISVGPNAAVGASIGPSPEELERALQQFADDYGSSHFFGDERLVAMAASHHRLTWLHPFRDGNGRVSRLFSTLYMARCGVNKANLWSLSRGLSKNKDAYMINLFSCDPVRKGEVSVHTPSEVLADFIEFMFEVCLDQIQFMSGLLSLETIEGRIEWYVHANSKKHGGSLHPDSSRLLRAAFMQGEVPRGEAGKILNKATSTARKIVKELIEAGLLTSDSPKSSLKVALPSKALSFYFPALYDPSVVGEDYMAMIEKK